MMEKIIKSQRHFLVQQELKNKYLTIPQLDYYMLVKQPNDNTFGVIDIDGAFRTSQWQLAYQLARSYKNGEGDFAGAAGFTMI